MRTFFRKIYKNQSSLHGFFYGVLKYGIYNKTSDEIKFILKKYNLIVEDFKIRESTTNKTPKFYAYISSETEVQTEVLLYVKRNALDDYYLFFQLRIKNKRRINEKLFSKNF